MYHKVALKFSGFLLIINKNSVNILLEQVDWKEFLDHFQPNLIDMSSLALAEGYGLHNI